MAESDILIVKNVSTGKLRLIITSHDGRTILSQQRGFKSNLKADHEESID
jgi:hypothetical protein